MASTVSRFAVGCAALLVGASSAFAHQDMPRKGTCGYIASMLYPFAYQYGPVAGPGWGLNLLATFDFEARTLNGNIVLIDPNAHASVRRQQTISGPFTVAAGPFAGSYTVTANFTVDHDRVTFVWNVVPVNGGRTLLMQAGPGAPGSADGGMAGVCQF